MPVVGVPIIFIRKITNERFGLCDSFLGEGEVGVNSTPNPTIPGLRVSAALLNLSLKMQDSVRLVKEKVVGKVIRLLSYIIYFTIFTQTESYFFRPDLRALR
jgi:hypothetical protein